jgi:hypothetical protein
MISMGLSGEEARKISSDVLGTEMPMDLVESVSIPLSTALKKDIAVRAKSSYEVYTPNQLIVDVVWEDDSLVRRSQEDDVESETIIDWARIDAIAKYIGTANALADPTYAEMASSGDGVPYALVNNHCCASVSQSPCLAFRDWKSIEPPEGDITAIKEEEVANVVDNIADGVYFSACSLSLDRTTLEPNVGTVIDALVAKSSQGSQEEGKPLW